MQQLTLTKEIEKRLEKFMKVARAMKDFKKVEFIFLYGSVAEGKANALSDIDICIYFNGNYDDAFDFRVKLSSDSKIDVQIFQQLPLYVRVNVLKGKVLYVKNREFLYDVAYKTIQEFEDLKPHYYEYIDRI